MVAVPWIDFAASMNVRVKIARISSATKMATKNGISWRLIISFCSKTLQMTIVLEKDIMAPMKTATSVP